MLHSVLLWLRIIRPQTLFASLVPVLVAVLVTARHGFHVDALTTTVTVCCALALQILSNLINDYYDFVRGTDRAGRAGFRRALAEGEVSASAMRSACLVAGGIACMLGFYLIYIGGVVILAIGISALLFAWLYTATSHSLSYLGIADIFVFLYYGVIASCGTSYLLLSGSVSSPEACSMLRASFFAGGVSGLVSMCVLFINNLRDIDSDREAGKHTLPVRFGKRVSHVMMLVIVLLMPFFSWLAFGYNASMLILVPAFLLWLKVVKAQGAEYNRCLVLAGINNVIYFLLSLI